MGRKVVAVLGSNRARGNSARLLDEAIASFDSSVVDVERIELGKIRSLAHCTGCDACKKSKDHLCVIDDGLNDIIRSIRSSEAMIIACPVFFFSFNSLTKAFIDRLFYSSELRGEDNLLKGMAIGLIVTYGGADVIDSGAAALLQSFYNTVNFCGLEIVRVVEGKTTETEGPGERLLDEARALGRLITSRIAS